MSNLLKIGTVLMQTGAYIPESVWVERETYSPGWEEVTNLDGEDLDRLVRRENWNFFFFGGALQGMSWGSPSGSSVRCAAIRVLKKSKLTKLNGFEITGIHARRFLGIPYTNVTGHSRHIQKSTVLQNIAERIHQASQSAAISTSAGPFPAPVLAR